MIGLIVLTAVLIIGSRTDSRVLDLTQAQPQIEQMLRDPVEGYAVTTIEDLICNNGANPPVRQDTSFLCQGIIDGLPKRVTVVFQDNDGTFAVDRPR